MSSLSVKMTVSDFYISYKNQRKNVHYQDAQWGFQSIFSELLVENHSLSGFPTELSSDNSGLSWLFKGFCFFICFKFSFLFLRIQENP